MRATEPGDLLFVKTNHFVSKLIRFGQRGYGKEAAQWNHVAVFVGNGQIVEALTKGVVLSPENKYPASDTKVVLTHPYIGSNSSFSANDMRANAASFARSCVGEKYGWTTIAAIVLKVLFKGKWNFCVQGTSICSGLAARQSERLGYNWNPNDPAELTPAYLEKEV
jgi:uncharacterized protein YycO